jgi:hypothetical protein
MENMACRWIFIVFIPPLKSLGTSMAFHHRFWEKPLLSGSEGSGSNVKPWRSRLRLCSSWRIQLNILSRTVGIGGSLGRRIWWPEGGAKDQPFWGPGGCWFLVHNKWWQRVRFPKDAPLVWDIGGTCWEKLTNTGHDCADRLTAQSCLSLSLEFSTFNRRDVTYRKIRKLRIHLQGW